MMVAAQKDAHKSPVQAFIEQNRPAPAKSKKTAQRAFTGVHEHPSTPSPREPFRVQIPAAFDFLFAPSRYKVAYGGRAGAKSTNAAQALVVQAAANTLRVLCAREFQVSMRDSVMELLKTRIDALKLSHLYRYGRTYIEGKNGSEFVFKGLRTNPAEIKSLEGIDICWVEEAQRVSEESWVYLIPTIRKEGSEIWVTFNPDAETDPTFRRFVKDPPENAVVRKVGWQDNPWFNVTMEQERQYALSTDPDAYEWIWEGHCRKVSDAVVFRGKFVSEEFETPRDVHFFYGADWGFGPDPTVLVRCFIKDKCLYVDRESYAFGLDLDKIAPVWRAAVPGCTRWPIEADNSQPQTIKHVSSFGFTVRAAKKWPGSVEDGIAYLRSFEKIVVHPKCYYTGQEMRLYSYKTDRVSGAVLPVLLDKHNHCIDALRYALGARIGNRRKRIMTTEQAEALADGI